MKKSIFRKAVPHLIAIVVFLIISILFCRPALEGDVLNQSDISGWRGMAQNSFEYKDKHGHFPIWNPNLFSGMPNYQVALDGKTVLPDLNKIFTWACQSLSVSSFLPALVSISFAWYWVQTR